MAKEVTTPEDAAKGPKLPIDLPPSSTTATGGLEPPTVTADTPELTEQLQGERPEAATRLKSTAQTAPITADQSAPSATQPGRWFVKNRLNELVTLPDGKTTYKFRKSREYVTDPKIIAGLLAVATKYQIFPEPVATAAKAA